MQCGAWHGASWMSNKAGQRHRQHYLQHCRPHCRALLALLISAVFHVALLFMLVRGLLLNTAAGPGPCLQVTLLPLPQTGAGQPVAEVAITPAPDRMPGGLPYVPASRLTERPVIWNDIDPELSERFSGVAAQSLRLTLLINEYGDVDRVLFDDGDSRESLPAVLRDELEQRFLAARFLPGRLHGRPVPSALRIAVDLRH